MIRCSGWVEYGDVTLRVSCCFNYLVYAEARQEKFMTTV